MVDSTVTAVVQINGKVKERLEVPTDISEAALSEMALASVEAALSGTTIRTTIVRPPKLVNIVTSDWSLHSPLARPLRPNRHWLA